MTIDEELEAEATIRLIRDGDYNLIRPSADIIQELVAVIRLLDKQRRDAAHDEGKEKA